MLIKLKYVISTLFLIAMCYTFPNAQELSIEDSVMYYIKEGKHQQNDGKYFEAIDYYSNGLRLFESYGKELTIKQKENKALALNNIGISYYYSGIIEPALVNFHDALLLFEELKDSSGITKSYNNLGLIYMNQGDPEKAVEFYHKCCDIRERINDKFLGDSYWNIAMAYDSKNKLKNSDSTIKYLEIASQCYKELNTRYGDNSYAVSLGYLYSMQSKFKESIEAYKNALELYKQGGDQSYVSEVYNNISMQFYYLKELDSAQHYAFQGLIEGEKHSTIVHSLHSYKTLYQVNQDKKDWQKAFLYLEKYHELKDSIRNSETEHASIQQQEKYKYEKQKLVDDANHEKEITLFEANQRQQKIVIGFVSLLLLIMLFSAYIIYKRLQTTRKQKSVIEQQKNVVEDQHQQIQSSINYASRIQNALLSNEEYWNNIGVDRFILFKPRDVVSGDFYWAYSDSKVAIWAVADCTGHGVPGAFMSMLGISFLNEIVVNNGERQPSQILNELRIRIINAMAEHGKQGADGMDIALCYLNRENQELIYAGAYNPLILVRNNDLAAPENFKKNVVGSNYTLFDFAADRMPVGKHVKSNNSFKDHKLEVYSGDKIYLFTDGYQDQFGGSDKTKYKVKQLKNDLLQFNEQKLNLASQNNQLDSNLEDWMNKGKSSQIDDVCLVGVSL